VHRAFLAAESVRLGRGEAKSPMRAVLSEMRDPEDAGREI